MRILEALGNTVCENANHRSSEGMPCGSKHFSGFLPSFIKSSDESVGSHWSWYSGRYHKVIRGQDLLGIVFTIHHIAFPVHVLFCPKQGRYHTTKADLLLFMLTQLKTAFLREGIDITQLPLTMDSAYVSQELRERLHQ